MRTDRARLGFTLTELMVSLAVLGLISGYLTWVLGKHGQSFQVVDQVTESQQSLRAISDLLERETRATGFMVTESAAFCGRDNTNAPDIVYLSDSESIMPQPGPVGAEVVNGFGGGTGLDTIRIDNVVLDGLPFYDTDANGVADSDFQVGGGVIVADPNDSSRGAACGVITAIRLPDTIEVDYAMGGRDIGVAGSLVAVPAHVYRVNANFQLLRDEMLLAGGIEDLQFAVFFDVDDDGELDAAVEDPGSAAFGGSYLSNVWDNDQLREIRINVVGRSRNPDPEFAEGTFQVTENRVAPGGGSDGFRRRIVTAAIRPRNVGQRVGS